MALLLLTILAVAAATESHMAYILSLDHIEQQQGIFINAFIREIDELQIGDVTIKQKTEHARLNALLQSVKLSSLDFSQTAVKVQIDTQA
jgi:hypothetical protein